LYRSLYLVSFNFLNGIRGNTDGAEVSPGWQVSQWWKIRSGNSYLHIHLSDQPGFTSTVTLKSLHGSSPNSQAFLQSQIDIARRWQFDQVDRFAGALPAQSVRAYRAYDLGANSYLVKPGSPALLLEIIQHLDSYWLTLNQKPDLGHLHD
jgi:hypothetical protein